MKAPSLAGPAQLPFFIIIGDDDLVLQVSVSGDQSTIDGILAVHKINRQSNIITANKKRMVINLWIQISNVKIINSRVEVLT